MKRFGSDFVDTLTLRRARTRLAKATIYSTGDALGGGLAQQLAYALPPHPDVPHVSEVYAFDPSPVTGYLTVKRAECDTNKIGRRISLDLRTRRGPGDFAIVHQSCLQAVGGQSRDT